MQYLDCPNCHARLRSGLLWLALESCPRCGASLPQPHPRLGTRLRTAVSARRRTNGAAMDWEEITRSQYAHRQYVSRRQGRATEGDGDAAA
jgi:hypothetical protein